MASASSLGSPGVTSHPVSPGTTTSRSPPVSEATTGRPCAIASAAARPQPSDREGMMNRSNAAKNSSRFSMKPGSWTRRSGGALGGFSPARIIRSCGIRSLSRATAAMATSCPFSCAKAPRWPTTKWSSVKPNLARAAARCSSEAIPAGNSTPFGMTSILLAGTPACNIASRTATDTAMMP